MCTIDNINLLVDKLPEKCTAKFRYRSKEVPVSIEYLEDNKISVKYSSGASAVTPGQTCALYLGEECIGGGQIKIVKKDGKKLWYL